MNQELSHRYTALDVLRGMTIAAMILVNNPGTWNKIFPPLRHAEWHGCTPTDLIFPFFLFIVGAALSFSFAKYENSLNKESVTKVVKRSFLIFLTGYLLNAFPFYTTSPNPSLSFFENWINYFTHVRVFGVLQRIALCYLVGALLALWLKKPKKIVIAALSLMFLHWLILVAFGGDSPFSKEGNISGLIDLVIVGSERVYRGYGLPFDPEGLLGTLSGSATLLFGYLAGGLIRNSKDKVQATAQLYTIGLLSLGIAMVMSIFIPINKPLWTPSYVLYAGGWAVIMLAFFIYLIDIKGREKLFYPFKALGLNPLFAFVMAGVLAKVLGRVIRWRSLVVLEDGSFKEVTQSASSWIYNNCCVSLLGHNEFASLLYALLYVALFTAMAIWLYERKIVIKI